MDYPHKWVSNAWCRRVGGWFNMKVTSHQYRKSHCVDKIFLGPSDIHNEIFYTGNTASSCWILSPSYQYRKSHCGDKAISLPSYLHNRTFYISNWDYIVILNKSPDLRDCFTTVLSPQWDFLYWQDYILVLNQGPALWQDCILVLNQGTNLLDLSWVVDR